MKRTMSRRTKTETLTSTIKVVGAKELLKEIEKKSNIKDIKYIPPKLGRPNDFGKFVVKYGW